MPLSRATGIPRSVITTSSPVRAASIHCLSSARSALTETSTRRPYRTPRPAGVRAGDQISGSASRAACAARAGRLEQVDDERALQQDQALHLPVARSANGSSACAIVEQLGPRPRGVTTRAERRGQLVRGAGRRVHLRGDRGQVVRAAPRRRRGERRTSTRALRMARSTSTARPSSAASSSRYRRMVGRDAGQLAGVLGGLRPLVEGRLRRPRTHQGVLDVVRRAGAQPAREQRAAPRRARRTRCCASARECRRGSRGVSSATTSATAPPIAASIHRPSGPPLAVSAGRPTITSAWTPACVVSRTPRSMNRAIVAARNRTTATCQMPLPMRRTSTSPSATPIATPTASSATRRTDRSAVNPSATHAQTGAKNGYGWLHHVAGEPERDRRRRSPPAGSGTTRRARARQPCRTRASRTRDARPGVAGRGGAHSIGCCPSPRATGPRGAGRSVETPSPGTIASWLTATAPPSLSTTSSASDGRRPLHHGERDRPELVVPRDGRHGARPTRPGSCDVSVRTTSCTCGADLGQHVPGPVEVQHDEPSRRAPEVVHARDRLLPAVAALVQVHGGAQPVQLVRDRAVVDLVGRPRPPRLDAHRLAGPGADERPAGRLARLAPRRRAGRAGPGRAASRGPRRGARRRPVRSACHPRRSSATGRARSPARRRCPRRRRARRWRPSRRSRPRSRPGA